MASKEQKERATIEFAAPLVKQAVLATEGVAGLYERPPITDGVLMTNIFGNVEIEVYVEVFYGCNIPEVSWNIQESVKRTLAEERSLKPSHINIHIEGVDFSNVKEDEAL